MSSPVRVSSGVAPTTGLTGAAHQVAAAASTDVVCPGCGAIAPVRTDLRSSADFCTQCDHPLFWAGVAPAQGSSSTEGVDARYRAPGVAGSASESSVPCPACAERNDPASHACLRCGSALVTPLPSPPAPAPAPAPPQVVTIDREVPCEHPRTWVVALVTAALTALVTTTVVLLIV